MGFEVDDGTGQGYSAKVGSDNRLYTRTVQISEGHHINQENQKNWALPFEGVNPTAANDYIFYLRNSGNTDLYIADFRLSADTAATQLKIHSVSGVAAGGTTLVPINKTIGASPSPNAIIEYGADITGLTDDGTIYFMQLAVVDTLYHLRIGSKIRIPKGKAVALSVETPTANITGVVSLYESE
jgi:hypothetical protein